MMEQFWVQAIVAFASMTLLDFIWAHYTIFLLEKRHILAGLAAGGIMLCNAIVVVGYVSNHWLILPTAAGAFTGTFLASKWRKS